MGLQGRSTILQSIPALAMEEPSPGGSGGGECGGQFILRPKPLNLHLNQKGRTQKEKEGWVLRLEETTLCSNPSFDRGTCGSERLPDLALVTYSKLMTELAQSSAFRLQG